MQNIVWTVWKVHSLAAFVYILLLFLKHLKTDIVTLILEWLR